MLNELGDIARDKVIVIGDTIYDAEACSQSAAIGPQNNYVKQPVSPFIVIQPLFWWAMLHPRWRIK